ncbi:hypothetical protein GCM10010363_39850 [Streptomyces omiyaensis]|uniref:hypothetical protein n=1 Tax=Streptomyces omiyaensis TaxID=68247 RepID=UPI001678BF34|nr:hypothetical protein GCM10010363_39850 [Streptomyces omiyaensis]
MRTGIAVVPRSFGARPRGRGAVALDGLMEDAATAEIARVRIRQWPRHRVIGREAVLGMPDEEPARLGAEHPWAALDEIGELFERTALVPEPPPSFTSEASTRRLVRTAATGAA